MNNANLKSRVFKNGTHWGYQYVDRHGEESVILKSGLESMVVVDQLTQAGWLLVDVNTMEYRKDGQSSLELPTVTVEQIGCDISQQQEVLDIDVISPKYDIAELSKKVVKQIDENKEYFRQGTDRINTREDFLNFLKLVGEGNSVDSELSYMPLNSFVNKEALFTAEEYILTENKKYRKIIEDRRYVSMKQHMQMIEKFKQLGLSISTAEDIIDSYFSWGVCGLNLKVSSIKDTRSKYKVGTVRKSDPEFGKIKYYHLGAVDRNAQAFLGEDAKGKRIYPINKSDSHLRSRAERLLFNDDANEITPAYFESPIDEKHTKIEALGVTITYSQSLINYSFDYLAPVTIGVYEVEAPVRNDCKLRREHWNLENTDDIFNELLLHEITRETKERLRVTSDASSYNALRSLGLDTAATLTYIMSKPSASELLCRKLFPENYSSDPNDVSVLSDFVKHQMNEDLKQYLYAYLGDTLDEETPEYGTIESFINDVTDGSLNVDGIESGANSDSAEIMNNNIYENLKVAENVMGISKDEVFNYLDSDIQKYEYMTLTGNGKSMRIPLKPIDRKFRNYNNDRKDYVFSMFKDAMLYLYINTVYTEITINPNSDNPRHVAVDGWKFQRTHKPAQDKAIADVSEIIIEKMASYNNYNVQKDLLRKFSESIYTGHAVMYAIMEAIASGDEVFHLQRYLVPEIQEKVQAQIPKETLDVLLGSVHGFTDSLVAIQNVLYTSTGWKVAIVNASLAGDYVVPNKGARISEEPFITNWFNTASPKFNKDLTTSWINKGALLEPWAGLRTMYNSDNYYIMTPSETNIYGIEAYHEWAMEMFNNYPEGKPFDERLWKPFISSLYPKLYNYDIEGDILGEPVKKSLQIHERRFITREIMLNRNEGLLKMFDPTPRFAEEPKGIYVFRGYRLEDMRVLGSFDRMRYDFMFNPKLERPLVKSQSLYFQSKKGEGVHYTSIVHLDSEKYAVRQIQNRHFLVEDVKGKLWEVFI